MHKLLVVAAVLLSLALAGPAYAVDLQVGPSFDLTLSKDIDIEGTEAEIGSQSYDLILAAELAKGFTLSPKIGFITNSITIGDTDFNSRSGFGIGTGVQADLVNNDVVGVSLIGSYKYSRTNLDEIDASGVVISNPLRTIIQTHEWEVGVMVSKDFGLVRTYLGLVYSDLQGDVESDLGITKLNADLRAESNLGLRCGLAAELIENIGISLDAKFIDEISIGGTVSYRF